MRFAYTWLVIRALWEIARYDIVNSIFGFKTIHRQMAGLNAKLPLQDPVKVREVCDAVVLAACFYWKPILCLQRSVAAARLLRKSGIEGKLVIGYRPVPFLSHAWVEVDGRVVNDSQAYKQRLLVLSTL